MVIFSFDVDSVLLDTEEEILNHIDKVYNKKLTQKDVTHWTFYSENFPAVIDLFQDPNLYKNIKAIDGMVETMEKIVEHYGHSSIQLVTSSHEKVASSKEKALNSIFGHIKDWEHISIIHVGLKDHDENNPHHKHEHSIHTIMIDDAIHNIEGHINHHSDNKGILVDFGYGWNQDFEHPNVKRVKSPKELLDTVNHMLSNQNN
ncbi:hypothetical protein HOK00_06570 [bacterium]|jgi:5'(3')-deoxyribonucleotidase|nr:hypothetical protein [bacterium]